jgi:hypothetical protein
MIPGSVKLVPVEKYGYAYHVSIRPEHRRVQSGVSRIGRDHDEPQRVEIIRVESEDVLDIVVVGDDATRVIDKRNLLVIVPSEPLTRPVERVTPERENIDTFGGTDRFEGVHRRGMTDLPAHERGELGEHVSARDQRAVLQFTVADALEDNPCPIMFGGSFVESSKKGPAIDKQWHRRLAHSDPTSP